jgi:hypothetical protein
MNKLQNTSQRIRAMITQGYTNKDIVAQLHVKPQIVYNVRYDFNKGRGIGALPRTGTGIPTTVLALAPVPVPVPAPQPKPKLTFWQRIVRFFTG